MSEWSVQAEGGLPFLLSYYPRAMVNAGYFYPVAAEWMG